jgi:capsular exopolysaccharide synthesis family protein
MNENPKKPAASSSDEGGQFRVQTILIALRCWWKIATPLGIVLAVGAAAAVFYFSKPQYTASTWLLIRDRPLYLLENQWTEDPKKTIENQLELMRSPPVIDPVASMPAVANTPEIARERHPVQALRKLLKIRPLGRSDYFVIEFTSEDPERAALIVNAVAQAYLRLQQSSHTERQSVTIRLLDKQLTEKKVDVERLRDNYSALWKQRTGAEAFPIGPNSAIVQIRDATSELQSKLVDAQIEQVFLKAQVDAVTELQGKELPDPPENLVNEHVKADEQVLLLQAKIAAAKTKLREHEEASARLDQNVVYQALKAEQASNESQLEKLTAELTKDIKAQLRSAAQLRRDEELKALQQRLTNAEFTVTILGERIAAEAAKNKSQNSETAQLEFARSDYQNAESLYQAIAVKVSKLRAELDAPNPVDIFKEAEPPPSPDGDQPFKKMAIVAFAAFLLPFGLAVLIEHLYRRVCTRDQLETGNGIPVVGEVTALPRRARARKKGTKSVSRELQLFEESIDGLRTYLSLVHSVQGMQVLAVTSAITREGKTSLAAQLAISIASATGESTLLIDGDMRSPDIHRAFDVPRGPGLVEVLQGAVSPEEAIYTEYSESLHLLPAGALSSSPHKLLGTDEFRTMLEGLKGRYQHILIDTPPLLPASEALLLARAADAAVVCVRRDYSRLDQTMEAFARLRAAGVKVAGAVLNGIPPRTYVYRYGSYYAQRPRLNGAAAGDLAG